MAASRHAVDRQVLRLRHREQIVGVKDLHTILALIIVPVVNFIANVNPPLIGSRTIFFRNVAKRIAIALVQSYAISWQAPRLNIIIKPLEYIVELGRANLLNCVFPKAMSSRIGRD